MQVVVYLEERFLRDCNGNHYSVVFGDDYWARYLSVYSSILVVARAELVSTSGLPDRHQAIRDMRISFASLPAYKGPLQFLVVFLPLLFSVLKCSRIDGVHILRLPGAIGSMALPFFLLFRRSFGVELVGDPFSVFANGGVSGRLSSVYQCVFTWLTRKACSNAAAVAYVTKQVMQKAYPVSHGAFTTHYSSIQLDSALIVSSREIRQVESDCSFTILMVGSMEQRYKGFDVMIRALRILRQSDFNVVVKIAGDGAYRAELESLAHELNVADYVFFLGLLSRESVLSLMDEVDLFVMPSRTEGLPRALIEAMARGLPALGSDVGGIPELLDDEYIFESENYENLAVMVESLINDGSLRVKMSKKNIEVARSYEIGELKVRQRAFYEYLSKVSAA